MIVFAAFTPHTPLLLPWIGKQHLEHLVATRGALDHLAQELRAAHPDTIVLFSAHGAHSRDAFSINLHDPYRIDLAEFGDLTTKDLFSPDTGLVDTIQRSVRDVHIPFTLFSKPVLDYGTAVPLLILTEHLPSVRVVPVSISGLSPKAHFEFGRALKEALTDSRRRIAVIATGDLSHALSAQAPNGFRQEGVEFDSLARDVFQTTTPSRLLQADARRIRRAATCSYETLLMLFGVMDGLSVRIQELSYEAPFGVGYSVTQAHLHP